MISVAQGGSASKIRQQVEKRIKSPNYTEEDMPKCSKEAITRARNLRKKLTDAERKLWLAIRRKQIKNLFFRKQVPIGIYIADFVCHEVFLIIEIDGGQHMENIKYDCQRTKYLEEKGYKVLRFWNNEVLLEFETVMEIIMRACER